MSEEQVTPTPENPIPDVDDIKPMIPNPAWADENEVPVASSSNEGQALVSTKKYVKGEVIVPEQTVTLDEDHCAQSSNVNIALFSEGTHCIANIGEEEYSGIVEIIGDTLSLHLNDDSIEFWINVDDELWYYNDNLLEGDESTIALYVAEPVYSWEPVPYIGYDIVVKCNDRTNNLSDYEFLKYDADKVISKIRNYELVNGILFYSFNYDPNVEGGTNVSPAILNTIGMYHDSGYIFFNRSWFNKYNTDIIIYSDKFEFNTDVNGTVLNVNYTGISKEV